jgi:hypothetical protein
VRKDSKAHDRRIDDRDARREYHKKRKDMLHEKHIDERDAERDDKREMHHEGRLSHHEARRDYHKERRHNETHHGHFKRLKDTD